MDRAKKILEQALSYKNCDGLIEENTRLEDAVLFAINEALRQPPAIGSLPPTEFLAKKGLLGKKEISMSDNRLLSLLSEFRGNYH